MTTPSPFGVYVHIPFCRARCDYCAFATWTDRHHLHDRYLDALATHLRREVEAGAPPASSVFVGGGTPSMVDPSRLGELLAAIPKLDDAEVTVECNPDDVTVELLRTYRAAGVNRVSLGMQSAVGEVLVSLGRTHGPTAVATAVDAVREAGFETFNLDVIYGAAGESVDQWRRTLEEVVALGAPHVSAYGLTVEPGTPLAAQPDRHPDDDDQATKYLLADELLSAAGLACYEISNWAQPGHECRHNLGYWAQGDYLALGCAAHGHRHGRRWWNLRTPERYCEAVEAGGSAEAGHELLDDDTRRAEALQLALRLRDGVNETAIDLDGVPDELYDRVDGRVRLTPAGRLMANELSTRLR